MLRQSARSCNQGARGLAPALRVSSSPSIPARSSILPSATCKTPLLQTTLRTQQQQQQRVQQNYRLRSHSTNMAKDHPEENSTLTAHFTVRPDDLASAISPDPSDDYARVLATPRIVGFMEIVCARMLIPHMSEGQLSVGVRVEMDHLAATPVGEEIAVTATFLRKEGKQFVFDAVITDRGGEVGRGVCRRAIIEEERLMGGAQKRMAKANKL